MIDLSGSGLADIATVMMADGYSGGASTDNWTGTLSFVPAPGALALLGLAGVAGRRRRR